MGKIPNYPNSRSIEIEDKRIFDEFLKKIQPQASDYTFTNIFLWGRAKNYVVSMFEGHILVKTGKNRYLQPIGPEPEKVIMSVLKNDDVIFERVTEDVAGKLDGLSVEEDRDNFDYVYEREKLIKLDGAKLYPKRSLAEQAMKYSPKIIPTCEGNSCLILQDEWCNERNCLDNPDLARENKAVQELFINSSGLDVMTVSIIINGKVASFAAGEPLNENTFVIHFEKGDTKYKGIYQLINREFVKLVPEKYRFINREQDLGIPGLRKAKKSYYPVLMVKKFIVRNG